MNSRLVLLLPIALLAACEKGEPMRVTINKDGASSTDNGRVEMGTDGFKADIELPGLASLGSKMKIDGVPLYPDSKVSGININDQDGRETVAIQFTSPADRAKVGEWFAGQFKDNRFEAAATPTGYAGKTGDGEWFALDLTAAGAQTRGEFRMGKSAP
jgi:hypothetical protein